MPRATVTIRELKNKETGIDLTVPTHKETRGKLLNATVEFQIVVVSKLSFFKSPSHKETDVVQYMIPKKFTDFEELHIKLNTTYPATIFPMLPKKALIINDAIIKDRRVRLDELVKFIAAQKKLASCSLVLEFLGVNPITAGSFRKTPLISVTDKEDDEKEENQKKVKERSDSGEKKPEEVENNGTAATESPSTNMFGEEEEEDLELFTEAPAKDNDIFANTISDPSTNTAQAKMFEEQDLGGSVSETEAKRLYLLPGDSENPEELTRRTEVFEIEDNSELLTFDEDLESLMITEAEKAKAAKLRETSLVTEIKHAPEPQSDPLNVFSFANTIESPEQSSLSATPKSESPISSTSEQESDPVTIPTKTSNTEPDSDSDEPTSPVPEPAPEVKLTPPTSPRPKPTPASKPTLPTSPKPKPTQPSKPKIPTSPKPIPTVKPTSPTSPRPTPSSKPTVPTSPKPKPTPASKPITSTSSKPKPTPSKPSTPERAGVRPVPTSRPTPAPRTMPVPAPRASKVTPVAKQPDPPKKQESREDNLGTDDLMKYIQENAADDEADLDLFS